MTRCQTLENYLSFIENFLGNHLSARGKPRLGPKLPQKPGGLSFTRPRNREGVDDCEVALGLEVVVGMMGSGRSVELKNISEKIREKGYTAHRGWITDSHGLWKWLEPFLSHANPGSSSLRTRVIDHFVVNSEFGTFRTERTLRNLRVRCELFFQVLDKSPRLSVDEGNCIFSRIELILTGISERLPASSWKPFSEAPG